MFDAIRDFFQQHLAPDSATALPQSRLQLATAALLVETMRSDADADTRERERVLELVSTHCGLDDRAAAELVALAETQSSRATDFFQFTSLINRHYNAGQKRQVLEQMWQVAYADGHINAHERHLLRKIAGLLYVSQADYLSAQRSAREALGLGPDA